MSNSFQFTADNLAEFRDILKRYPHKRAALLPTLHLVQEQHGHIPPEASQYVAGLLDIPEVDVREVLTFYSLFHSKPPGRHHIRLCMSLSCWLRGASGIQRYLAEALKTPSGGKSADGNFSWEVVPDCMGACEIAPMIQLDKDYYGNLTDTEMDQLLQRFNGAPSHGSDPE